MNLKCGQNIFLCYSGTAENETARQKMYRSQNYQLDLKYVENFGTCTQQMCKTLENWLVSGKEEKLKKAKGYFSESSSCQTGNVCSVY